MMKMLSITLMCIFIVTGCGNKVPLEIEKAETKAFNAVIIECGQNSMIVRPEESEVEYKSSDKFMINFVGDFEICSVNDNVRITYVGGINESYPAQIETINIELVK